MSADKALARDRELRKHATPGPWHQSGQGTRLRIAGPLPRATIVVDPYQPNPPDGLLLLHRVNTYEELEEEIERLRAALRDARTELDAARGRTDELPTEQLLDSLTRDLEARISAVLGDRRVARVASPPHRASR